MLLRCCRKPSMCFNRTISTILNRGALSTLVSCFCRVTLFQVTENDSLMVALASNKRAVHSEQLASAKCLQLCSTHVFKFSSSRKAIVTYKSTPFCLMAEEWNSQPDGMTVISGSLMTQLLTMVLGSITSGVWNKQVSTVLPSPTYKQLKWLNR